MSSVGKIYNITQDFTTQTDWPQKIDVCRGLHADMRDLALHRNEVIYFHWHLSNVDGSPPLGGAPSALVECSDGFLADVKKLRNFGTAYEESDHKTFRGEIAGPVDESRLKTIYVKTDNAANPSWNIWSAEIELQKLAYRQGQIGNVCIYDTDETSKRIRFLSPDSLYKDILRLDRLVSVLPLPPRGRLQTPTP